MFFQKMYTPVLKCPCGTAPWDKCWITGLTFYILTQTRN